MTPREFAALKRQWEQNRRYQLSMFAALQATLHNAHFRGGQHPQVFRPEEFMPSDRPTREQSWQEKRERIRAMLTAAWGARKQGTT